MCKCHDEVCGVLGSGKRDVRKTEILGRSLWWTEEGPKHEASTSPGTVGRTGIERGIEDGHQRSSRAGGDRTRRRRGNAGGNGEDEVQGLDSNAELHESGQVGHAICREGDLHEDGEPDTRKPEMVEEGVQILEGGQGDVGDAGAETRRCDRGCARADGARGPERRSTSGMMMVNGTVVKHWSITQASRALSTAEAEYYAVVTASG